MILPDLAFPQNGLLACDLLAMDLNENGRLDVGSVDSGEIMPLPKMIQVGGAWSDLAVAPDGSSIGFERAEPQWGTLDVGSPDMELNCFLAAVSTGSRAPGASGRSPPAITCRLRWS